MNTDLILREHQNRFTFYALVTKQLPGETRCFFLSALTVLLLVPGFAAFVPSLSLLFKASLAFASILAATYLGNKLKQQQSQKVSELGVLPILQLINRNQKVGRVLQLMGNVR